MADFGSQPAFPLPAVREEAYGVTAAASFGIPSGLNIRQYVWLQLFCAELSSSDNVPVDAAHQVADRSLQGVLNRLENLR